MLTRQPALRLAPLLVDLLGILERVVDPDTKALDRVSNLPVSERDASA